ncbi:MAG: SPFH domain-containing protein [Acetanaerobacterium sp.]
MLFYKWPANEIKKGAKLIIRAGQKAVFFANGVIEGVFEQAGFYDIASEIIPFLSTLKDVSFENGDTGMRAEVYFVYSKELLLSWGTHQHMKISTPEVPSEIPVGCNGNLIIEIRDYQKLIEKVADVKDTCSLEDISERIMGELNPIVAKVIGSGQQNIGVNALIGLQQNSCKLGKVICTELDRELLNFGMGAANVNILRINYPNEVQQMAQRVAGQSFAGNLGNLSAVQTADSFDSHSSGNNIVAIGAQIAQQRASTTTEAPAQSTAGFSFTACGAASAAPVKFFPECGKPIREIPKPIAGRFCPTCRKTASEDLCPECGTHTM